MEGRISFLPGPSDLADKLAETQSDLVVAMYRTSGGNWKFYRAGDSDVSLEEVGALDMFQSWLRQLADEEYSE